MRGLESVGIHTGKKSGAPVLKPSPTLNFSKKNRLHTLSTTALSVHFSTQTEFREFLASNSSRYIKPREGFSWITQDKKVQELVQTHCPEINSTFKLDMSSQVWENGEPKHNTVEFVNSLPSFTKEAPPKKASVITVGGIPSLFSAYYHSEMYKQGIFLPEDGPPVHILPPKIDFSTGFGSSMQFHVSHASPMYADKEFSSLKILARSVNRQLGLFPANPESSSYTVADTPLENLINPQIINVGLGYMLNEYRYKFRSLLGKSTIVDESIQLAITSGIAMDRISSTLDDFILERKGTIRIAYDQEETKEAEELALLLRKHGIKCKKVSLDEVFNLTGATPKVAEGGSFWEVEGDGNLNPRIIDILCKKIVENGGIIIEGMVEKIVRDAESGELSGLVVSESGKERFLATGSAYLSLGPHAKYVDCTGSKMKPVEPVIAGTGYSSFILVDKEIKRPLDANNHHFTPMKTFTNDAGIKQTLLKATGGGAIGTDGFNRDHALNNLYYATQVLFSDVHVDIIAAKSCVRPLNKQNSVNLQTPLPGAIIATGWGGTGITYAAGVAIRDVASKLSKNVRSPQELKSFVERYTQRKDEPKSI